MQWLCRNSSQSWAFLTSTGCHWLLNYAKVGVDWHFPQDASGCPFGTILPNIPLQGMHIPQLPLGKSTMGRVTLTNLSSKENHIAWLLLTSFSYSLCLKSVCVCVCEWVALSVCLKPVCFNEQRQPSGSTWDLWPNGDWTCQCNIEHQTSC